MIRDQEIDRLVKYAQGMGCPVHFKPYVKGSKIAGGWTIDGSEISIFICITSRLSKIDIVLTLIHEISHHKGYVENNRNMDLKVLAALEDESEKDISRKRVYLDEVKDSQYWEQIYLDTDCKFPISKLYAQRDFDIWCYEVYYKEGKFPNSKRKTEMSGKLREKYK